MSKITEALKLAEKTLRDIIRVYKFETGTPVTALAAIREALAEQDKQEPVAWGLAEKVRRDLDRQSCPDAYMRIAMESIVKHYPAPVSAKPCKECGAKQAQIDRLMLEYYPDEMTHEQMQEWERNIKPFVEPVKQKTATVDRDAFLAGYEEAQADANSCCVPPQGWLCTRQSGHDGPCAVIADDNERELVSRGMSRLSEPMKQEPVMDNERIFALREAEQEKQEPVAWVPLTDDDRKAAFESLPDALEGFMKKWGWLHFAKEIERRCKEKNK